MDILNKPITSLSFSHVESFCAQGFIEGIQLDYKRELPSKGLSKHFAALSNTRGGVIIIGVEEDASGKPSNWEGIVYDSKIADKIHQFASNVEPRPSYDVHVTEEKNGKRFVLVRIYEGDRTPYYVQNDANLYVRTGNITDPINLASPNVAESLFGKKEKAELARNGFTKQSKEFFQAALKGGERERVRKIAAEKENYKKKKQEAMALPDYLWKIY